MGKTPSRKHNQQQRIGDLIGDASGFGQFVGIAETDERVKRNPQQQKHGCEQNAAQQRVSFARSLAQLTAGRTLEPTQMLLLDEPIASLDVRHQLALLDHTRALARGGKVLAIVVLHDLALAHTFADRILVLQKGRLATIATRDEPLSRDLIEKIFEVSIAAEHCHGTPWRPLNDVHKTVAFGELQMPRAALSI